MSRLQLSDGDDHPEAARKHLDDASALHGAGRADGTAYLAGYVVECSLKALILLEQGVPPAGSPPPWRGPHGHDLGRLARHAASASSVAGARTARYLGNTVKGLAAAAIAAWNPEMRYRAPSMTPADATSWHTSAQLVYQETVGQMFLDGVL